MADAAVRINVQIEGAEGLRSLAESLRTIGGARREAAARPLTWRAASALLQAGGLGAEFSEGAGQAIARTLRAPFDVLSNSARAASGAVSSILRPFAQLLGTAATSAPTMIALGVAAVAAAAVGYAIFQVTATIGLLRKSFGLAQDTAEAQLRVIGRTRRTFPGIIGEAFSEARRRTGLKLGMAGALFGEAADAMNEGITRRFTEMRMGRGMRGDRDIFRRWGITPQAVARAEADIGRLDVTDWLYLFIAKREELDNRLLAARGTSQEQNIIQLRAMLVDDSLKLFGQNFADMVGAWSREDFMKLRANLQAAQPLGAAINTTEQDTIDYKIALESLKFTLGQMKEGIGKTVQPKITGLMEDVRWWLLPVEQGGYGMGESMRGLMSALSIKAWEVMEDLVRGIDVDTVNQFIDEIKNKWDPATTIKNLQDAVPVLIQFATALERLASVQGWLGGRQGGVTGRIGGALGAAINPLTAARRAYRGLVGEGGPAAGSAERASQTFAAPRGGAGPGGAAIVRPRIGGTREGAPTFRGERATMGAPAAGSAAAAAQETGEFAALPPMEGGERLQRQARTTTRRRGLASDEFNAARTGIFGAPGAANQTTITLKDGQKITVNKNVAPRFEGFLNEMIDRGYPVKSGGGYNYRTVRGGTSLSQHSWGSAVDINVPQNYLQRGTGPVKTDMPEEVEQIAWRHGLSWGARFGDPMHFEAMGPGAVAKTQEILRRQGVATAAAGPAPAAAAATTGAGAPPITAAPIISPRGPTGIAEGAREARIVGAALPGGRSPLSGVDPKLVGVIRDAEAGLPEGYKVEFFSGLRRWQGRGYHPRGKAVDVQIRRPDGTLIASQGEDTSGMYRQLARTAYRIGDERGLGQSLAWGGAFETSTGSGVPDLMHFDLGGERGRAFARYRRAAIMQQQGPQGAPIAPAAAAPPPPATIQTAAVMQPEATGRLRAGAGGKVDPGHLRSRAEQEVRRQGLEGVVPRDGGRYGIKTGAAHEWANYLVHLAKAESSFDPKTANISAAERRVSGGHGSHGLYQISPEDAKIYKLQNTNFTMAQLQDPETNLQATVAMHKKLAEKGGFQRGEKFGEATGIGAYWSPVRKGSLRVGPSPGPTAPAASPVGQALKAADEKQEQQMKVDSERALTKSTDAIKAQNERDRDTLTAKPSESKAIKEGSQAGEAAAEAFKKGISDVKIPVKSLTEEQKNREETKEAA